MVSKDGKDFTEIKHNIVGFPTVVGFKNKDNIQINPAVLEKQEESIALLEDIKTNTASGGGGGGGGIPANKATDAYGYQADSLTATYQYYFYEDGAGNWYILRETLSTGVYSYARGTGGYTSVYVDNVSAPSGTPTWGTYDEIFDNVGAESLTFDAEYGALVEIDAGHYQIHQGNHFFFHDHNEIDNGNSVTYLFQTGDKEVHFTRDLDGSTITMYECFGGTDRTGTTLQTVFNSNRNSAKTATFQIYKGVSGGTTDGTRSCYYKGGSSTNQSKGPMISRNDNEVILAKNSKYLMKITSFVNDNLTNIGLYWYEI
jgi:hypothetical protein